MKPTDNTFLSYLECSLGLAYSKKNDNPTLEFERNSRGDKLFVYEDQFFLFRSITSGIMHEVETDVMYFKKTEGDKVTLIPVWNLSSRSQVLLEEHVEWINQFRRTAYHVRMHHENILPIKGGESCPAGKIKYINICATDWKLISNKVEKITINDAPAFIGNYDGGIMMSLASLEALVNVPKPKKLNGAPHPAVNEVTVVSQPVTG